MSAGKISLTGDICDNKSMRAFLGVTGHYIVYEKPALLGGKRDLILCTPIISFSSPPGQHRGQDIGKSLVSLTDRAGISGKVREI